MKRLTVSAQQPYEVIIEPGALSNIAELIKEKYSAPRKICLVTDSGVGALYSQQVLESLGKAGFRVFRILFPAGEHSKNLTTYSNVIESMADEAMTRSDFILALGGGVVCDIAGFAAGTYMRGVDYVVVPTTLMSMIDSSIGGKTSINLLNGKNLSGIFWHPSMAIIDKNTLDTLPEARLKDGLVEALKSAVISDSGLVGHIMSRDYTYVIDRCLSIKKTLVEVDEFDTGLRQLLNFGHTIGHGIEKISSYSVTHGQAVAKGMIAEARAAYNLGYCKTDISKELERILLGFGFDTTLDYDPEELYQQALMDKKIREGEINIIIPDIIGKCTIKKISLEELRTFVFASVE